MQEEALRSAQRAHAAAMARVKTAAELANEVKIAEVRQSTPLENYYVTAEHILRVVRAQVAVYEPRKLCTAAASGGLLSALLLVHAAARSSL